ncbi:hypothetical protein GG681_01540 [Epibacterium sp. SM1969]|uniref:Stringent starvation protein B n=1 Tax=Tritonibacter aquimaris TaxID=2663379 RepID=A0A844AJB6_9RHOB|nr:ClpXP protease specificity-enhancing factor SspB [Tritonibacter aquimaris]MQY41310.1 hypothetical protein [Tritonibacter aquimaris]
MTGEIDYGNLMHTAMRSLIKTVLENVAEQGLPGNHHFFITFDTRHPDVQIAQWLCDRYPGEMTVVVQHWFENLEVSDEGFAITLNFGDSPEPLYIPFDAMRTFVDPSVEFGLRFESGEDEEEEATLYEVTEEVEPEAAEEEVEEAPQSQDAEIVSLDSFRKP